MPGIVYGGLDVHQKSIAAYLVCTDTGEVLEEQVPNDRDKLLKAARRWQTRLGELRLCYEASGAGFVVKRWLDNAGISCEVIAPSLIPKAPGIGSRPIGAMLADSRLSTEVGCSSQCGCLSDRRKRFEPWCGFATS